VTTSLQSNPRLSLDQFKEAVTLMSEERNRNKKRERQRERRESLEIFEAAGGSRRNSDAASVMAKDKATQDLVAYGWLFLESAAQTKKFEAFVVQQKKDEAEKQAKARANKARQVKSSRQRVLSVDVSPGDTKADISPGTSLDDKHSRRPGRATNQTTETETEI
jgi:primosomal protein N'